MAVRRLYIFWDPAIDGAFRRALERALGGLRIDVTDGDMADPDPDSPGLMMVVAAASGGWAAPAGAGIVVQGGPGTFPQASGAVRLEAKDIADGTARWSRLVEQLRDKLGAASLALAPEELEVRLDEAQRRVAETEQALAASQLAESNAVRERNDLQKRLVEARARAATLEQEVERLRVISEAGLYALGAAPQDRRTHIAEARQHADRASIAAALAAEMAARLPDAIAWGASAIYSGEHRNGRPHGHGVLIFRALGRETASYRGQFIDGRRAGHGVGAADDGLIWSGQWKNDEACGAGVLEAPDGRRFEGEVMINSEGAPRADRARGWEWPAPGKTTRSAAHHEAPPALPAPGAAKSAINASS